MHLTLIPISPLSLELEMRIYLQGFESEPEFIFKRLYKGDVNSDNNCSCLLLILSILCLWKKSLTFLWYAEPGVLMEWMPFKVLKSQFWYHSC